MIKTKVLKSGSKVFMARATGANGKFYHKTFPVMRDAKRWLIDQKAKKNGGEYLGTPNKTTIYEYLGYYIDTIRPRLENKSAWGYELDIKNHIIPILGSKKISRITFDDGMLLQKNILEKGLSDKTNNKVLALFKQSLEFACSGKGEHRLLDRNPLHGFPFFKTIDKEISYWEDYEIKDFLKNVQHNHYYNLYLIAINTGMRLGELAGLKVKKIDFKKNFVIVSNSLKRRKGGGYQNGSTKNKLTRYFPMNKTVRRIFLTLAKGKKGTDFVFTGENGRPVDIDHFCERKFKPIQATIGIEAPIRFHDLRHTYASTFMMNGGDLFTLQKLLGHKKIETTLIYAHLSPNYMQDAASIVEFDG